MFEHRLTEKLLPFVIFFTIFGIYSFIYEKQQESKDYINFNTDKKSLAPIAPTFISF
jgi:fucose 4-O-acetylase-like acetyltransferase